MFSLNLYTTSGLSILLYGVISLPGAMSYDNILYLTYILTLVYCLAMIIPVLKDFTKDKRIPVHYVLVNCILQC